MKAFNKVKDGFSGVFDRRWWLQNKMFEVVIPEVMMQGLTLGMDVQVEMEKSLGWLGQEKEDPGWQMNHSYGGGNHP